jgi:hypothetical protein
MEAEVRTMPLTRTREEAARVRAGRRVPWYISLPVTLVLLFLLVAGLLLAAARFDWLPGLPNPFSETTVDRSGPAVLRSVQDLSRYEAAEGQYQVVVDLDTEAKFLPSALLGNRTLYIGTGSVIAAVDFSGLGSSAVTVSQDRRTATLHLPHAALEPTALDPAHSYVFAQQRGFFNRIGEFFSSNPGSQQQLEVLAAQKIQTAAKASGLQRQAETNTKTMLQGMLHGLGFTTVTVAFG